MLALVTGHLETVLKDLVGAIMQNITTNVLIIMWFIDTVSHLTRNQPNFLGNAGQGHHEAASGIYSGRFGEQNGELWTWNFSGYLNYFFIVTKHFFEKTEVVPSADVSIDLHLSLTCCRHHHRRRHRHHRHHRHHHHSNVNDQLIHKILRFTNWNTLMFVTGRLLCEREDQEMEKVLQLSESTTPRKRGCCNWVEGVATESRVLQLSRGCCNWVESVATESRVLQLSRGVLQLSRGCCNRDRLMNTTFICLNSYFITILQNVHNMTYHSKLFETHNIIYRRGIHRTSHQWIWKKMTANNIYIQMKGLSW